VRTWAPPRSMGFKNRFKTRLARPPSPPAGACKSQTAANPSTSGSPSRAGRPSQKRFPPPAGIVLDVTAAIRIGVVVPSPGQDGDVLPVFGTLGQHDDVAVFPLRAHLMFRTERLFPHGQSLPEE